MRILRISQNLYPEVPGGGPYHVHALSRDQTNLGHEVTVVTVSENQNLPDREERDGYTVVRCRPRFEVFGNQISTGVFDQLRADREYDVVHGHGHHYFSTNMAAFRRYFSDVPFAITPHGIYSQSVPEPVFRAYLRTIGRWTLNQADLVFSYSEEAHETFRSFGVRSEFSVIRNGIDTSMFSPDGPTRAVDESVEFCVLFVGRLVEGKRPMDAVKAVEKLQETIPGIKLLIVGDGPLRSDLEQYVFEQGLAGAIEFLGQVDYDEMPLLYRTTDVLLLTSRAEGVPRVVLEALASKTPVVSSDLPQLDAILDKAGRRAEVGDVGGLVTALSELEANPSLRRYLGRAGHELVNERYDWSETVARMTTELESLAKI